MHSAACQFPLRDAARFSAHRHRPHFHHKDVGSHRIVALQGKERLSEYGIKNRSRVQATHH